MTQSTDIDTELAGKLSSSLSYTAVKTEAAAVEAISKSNFNSELFLVVSTMRVDRYFSGLKEESSPITADAKNLLEEQDYIEFSIPAEQIMYTVSAVHRRSLQSSSLIHIKEIWHKSLLLK